MRANAAPWARRLAWLRWLCLAVVLALPARASAAAEPRASEPAPRLLSIGGVIDAVTARYLERELGRAAADGAAVIVELDTPGGLESSMRDMVRSLLGARVPVVVYVAPAGARAASAGVFITLAANVAAMAPGTEIGAAHPVRLGGNGGGGDAMDEKIVNDAAAFARAIADARHRNPAWSERAVRESVSLTADEARREGIVDLVAADLPELLQQLDGRTVATAAGPRELHTAGARVDARPMFVTERALQIVSDPNVAYLLFVLGLIGIAAELYHPGAIVPGALGAVALMVALVAFGNLPISWAGLLLILLAIGLFMGELHTGVGALAVGAIVALVVGSLLLYSPPGPISPTHRALRVSPVVVGAMTALVAAFFLGVVRATFRARHLAVRTGVSVLVGHVGVATSELAPTGTVRVDSEVWTAETDTGPIHEGERVTVVGAAGVTLHVTRAEAI